MRRQPSALTEPEKGDEPILDVDEIQGNVLAGFNKDFQTLLALKIRDVAAARRWLRRITPEICSLAEVHRFNTLFKSRRARLGEDPSGLVATWANIAFSHDGLAALTSTAEADALPDEAFRLGMPERARGLGDPIAQGETDPTKSWVIGRRGRVPDVLLIVASDDSAHLHAAVQRIRPGAVNGENAPESIWEETGATLPGQLRGHEHFGFKDGISQPGIRGLVSRDPDTYLTPRLLVPAPPREVQFARPGQPLIWPGHFVLGYPTQSRQTGAEQAAPAIRPAWAKNGSFLVFRRLNQDVAAFEEFLRKTAASLPPSPSGPKLSPEHLGTLLVGRWPSGAPLSRSPDGDDPRLASDGLSNNDFLFTTDTPLPQFLPGAGGSARTFPTAKVDDDGHTCPFAAHIRKVNPRDKATDLGDAFDTLTRRIIRRGIPFGPPLKDRLRDDGVVRGLHFLCYQASIVDQFEEIQKDWANNSNAPHGGGYDLIIGQDRDQPRTADFMAPSGQPVHLAPLRQWVTPTGGGYFFSPSISSLRDILAGP